MPYLGNVPAEAYTNTVKDSFNGDGSTTDFTLSQPSTTNNLRVVVENVVQDPAVAYNVVNGSTLRFTSAPPTGTANIYAVHLGPAVQTAVPPSEINNATTYTSDLTVQGAFTSQGIDDNANATAITIDSSENVLVGKATSSTTSAGFEARSNGQTVATVDGGTALIANRSTSDGDIAKFMKDGTTVGSIGYANAPEFYIGAGDTGLGFGDAVNQIYPVNPSTNGHRDAAVDLGNSGIRFKDLYLSGGVYLGGTGSSNHLQDYEEGTWTPTLSLGAGSLTYSLQGGNYVKIGNVVYISINIVGTNTTNAFLNNLTNLPFTVGGYSGFYPGPTVSNAYFVNLGSNGSVLGGYWVNGSASLKFHSYGNNTNQLTPVVTGGQAFEIRMQGVYTVS